TLDVATAAGFGTAGVLSGEVDLGSNALLKFTSGQITQVANGGTLFITGTEAHLANVSDLTTNSALTGLTTNNGRIFLENGAAVNVAGGLTTTSELHIDNSGNTGGTTFTVGGTLTNTNFFGIGNGGAIGATTVTAAGLSNTGRITLGNGGGAAGMATLDVATAAGFGTAGVLSGEVDLG